MLALGMKRSCEKTLAVADRSSPCEIIISFAFSGNCEEILTTRRDAILILEQDRVLGI